MLTVVCSFKRPLKTRRLTPSLQVSAPLQNMLYFVHCAMPLGSWEFGLGLWVEHIVIIHGKADLVEVHSWQLIFAVTSKSAKVQLRVLSS